MSLAFQFRLLQLHLLEGLVRVLLIAVIWIKEEGPGFLAGDGSLGGLLMEGVHVTQDWVESGGANELVSDLNDAGPELVLQLLLII